jgi:divalent metal cation (Fe/Co/Zn/Cd) transporter
VLLGAGGVALGWTWADPAVGLLITVAILGVLRSAIRQVGARLMDAVEPKLVDQAAQGFQRDPADARLMPEGQVRAGTTTRR